MANDKVFENSPYLKNLPHLSLSAECRVQSESGRLVKRLSRCIRLVTVCQILFSSKCKLFLPQGTLIHCVSIFFRWYINQSSYQIELSGRIVFMSTHDKLPVNRANSVHCIML